MTPDEARRVQRIVNQADGGCDSCARDLMMTLIVQFPEHEMVFRWEFFRGFPYHYNLPEGDEQ